MQGVMPEAGVEVLHPPVLQAVMLVCILYDIIRPRKKIFTFQLIKSDSDSRQKVKLMTPSHQNVHLFEPTCAYARWAQINEHFGDWVS